MDIASAACSSDGSPTVLRLWPIDGDTSTAVELPTGPRFAAFAAERVSSAQVP